MKKNFLKTMPLVLFLLGCSTPNIQNQNILLSKIIQIDKLSSYKAEDSGFFKEVTIPAFIGPSLLLSKEEYFIKKIKKEPLLFKNFGVFNYTYLFFHTSSWNKLEAKAKKYGHKNTKTLFKDIFMSIHTLPPSKLYKMLLKLDSEGFININNINKKEIDIYTDKIISTMYQNYFKYEKIKKIKEDWFFKTEEEKISIKREEYQPYALALLITEEILNSNKKGKINEF